MSSALGRRAAGQNADEPGPPGRAGAPAVAPVVPAGARLLRGPGGDIGGYVLAAPEGNGFCAFTQ